MAVELKVPNAGESITEVQIGQWLKGEGDYVQLDEPVVEIDTDKVSMEIPAPVAGVITSILKAQGDPATVNEVIGTIDETAPAPEGGNDAGPAAAPKAAPPAPAPKPTSAAPPAGESAVMPAAQRVLAQKGIDAATVKGSGRSGRILKEDAERATTTPAPVASAPPPVPTTPTGSRHEEVVPMTPLRKSVARRLVESQANAAILTTFNEIDMSASMAMRRRYKDAYLERYGVKLGFMSLFVKAAVDALKLVPAVNAEIRDDNIIYRNYFDIGVAIGGGRGLVVPVIRNAELLSFAEIEAVIGELATRAQANKIKLEELQGGTFTISNGGVYDSMLSTPIINPPQSGILGMHGILNRPVAVDGEVVIRPMMYVALSYDHRMIDGREAVTFLKRIKECIENPERMLLEI